LLDFLAGVEAVDVPVDAGIGVEVPDVAAELVICGGSSTDGNVAVMSGIVVEDSVGAVPPRRGERMCRVAAGCKARSATVLEGDRW
jgi:hypothetical protein